MPPAPPIAWPPWPRSSMTTLASWTGSWPQDCHHNHPEDHGWPWGGAVAWWLRISSLLLLGCCQSCGHHHPWTKWEAYWHGLLCLHPQQVGLDLIAAWRKLQIWWHQEGGEAGVRGPPQGHPELYWGLVVSYDFNSNTHSSWEWADAGVGIASMIILSISFSRMRMNLAIATGWWTL